MATRNAPRTFESLKELLKDDIKVKVAGMFFGGRSIDAYLFRSNQQGSMVSCVRRLHVRASPDQSAP